MDTMEAKMQAWRKRMPTKRQLTSTLNQFVQQKSVSVLYTPIEQERIKTMTEMITKATSDYESDEDWDRILRVVDALSNISSRAVLKESIRYLRLRLGDPSPRVVILALTLTESIVKNCGNLVHQEIATESFMNELEDLYRSHANKRGRDSLEIAARVLEMVQAWGEAFLPYRHEFPLFIETYHNMRKKGVKFPEQYDDTKVPVLTPPPAHATSSSSNSNNNRHARNGTISTSSESSSIHGYGGLSPEELHRVATNVVDMFEDMLYEVQKSMSSISTRGVIQELAAQAKELAQRMEGLIQIAVTEDSDDIGKYLSINDSLHNALNTYEELQRRAETDNQQEATEKVATSKHTSRRSTQLIDPFGLDDEPSKNQQDNDDTDDDDPFAEFVRARAGSSAKSSDGGHTNLAAVTASTSKKIQEKVLQDEDEDDPFATFVQQRATKILSNQDEEPEQKSPAVIKDLIDLWDDVPTSTESKPAPTPIKNDLLLDDPFGSFETPVPPAPIPVALNTPLIDNLWNTKSAAPTPAAPFASIPQPLSTTSNTSNPFDLLDFEQKTTISAPTSNNPFDILAPPPQATKPANPFDF